MRIRFERPNYFNHTKNCFKHVEKRVKERFDVQMDEFEHCLLVDRIEKGVIGPIGRVSTHQFWVSFQINGRTCYALYNEAFQVLQTVYTPKMFEKHRYKIAG
ncbi:MAG: hypothetical protein KC478_17590 [Bacteriovoracaceae bacterium]|nr:hypothetical protein [Bacteriovoracaceae bacterium]